MQVATVQQTPTWTAKDVAEYWGVSKNTVYKWVYNGKLTVHRTPGNGLRFVEQEVKAAQPTEQEWHGRKR